MQILDKIIADINTARENIIRGVIEKIEGRPAELSDAENLILASYPTHISSSKQMIIYRDIHIGFIDVDVVGQIVTFTPIEDNGLDVRPCAAGWLCGMALQRMDVHPLFYDFTFFEL